MKKDPSGYWKGLGVKFSEDQPRDAHGRWTNMGAGDDTSASTHHTDPEYSPMHLQQRDKYMETMRQRLESDIVQTEGKDIYHFNSPLHPWMIRTYFKQDGWAQKSSDEMQWEKGHWTAVLRPDRLEGTRVTMKYDFYQGVKGA